MTTEMTEKTPAPDAVECAANEPRDLKFFPGVFTNFLSGLRVMGSEGKWLLKLLIKRFEISRLKKRLDQECLTLGRLTSTKGSRKKDKDLANGQIVFLREEIAALEQELEVGRKERLAALRGEDQ